MGAFPIFPQGFSAGLQTDSAARRFAVCGTQPIVDDDYE
jgi:hypothetical protein